MPTLFTPMELDLLDRCRQVLASRKMVLLKLLQSVDAETHTAFLLRKQRNAIDKALDNFPNWRQLEAETKGE